MNNEKWNAEDIPTQQGRVAIVTGSSSGIGYEAARVLANKGASVIIAVRNQEKGNSAAAMITAQNKDADIRVMILDLADLGSVKDFADKFKSEYSRLDLLINNAGVMIPPYSKTADGFELQFGTNHLGHFALTGRLLDLLIKTEHSRIINVSSSAHRYGGIDFDDLNWEKRKYSAWRGYSDSKIANIYFTDELDRRLKEQKIDVLTASCHPGWTATELQRHTGLIETLNGYFAQDISMGALPTLRAAIDENVKGGEYFGPDGLMGLWGFPIVVDTVKLAQDREIAARLWAVSEDLTGVKFEFGSKASSVGR